MSAGQGGCVSATTLNLFNECKWENEPPGEPKAL